MIFQEVNQDLLTFFNFLVTPSRTVDSITTTAPHEIGHQLGLYGDQTRTTFELMDYSNYSGNVSNNLGFHPEHINIMRWRVKSPGQ